MTHVGNFSFYHINALKSNLCVCVCVDFADQSGEAGASIAVEGHAYSWADQDKFLFMCLIYLCGVLK